MFLLQSPFPLKIAFLSNPEQSTTNRCQVEGTLANNTNKSNSYNKSIERGSTSDRSSNGSCSQNDEHGENLISYAIYKVGDDLRQDQLTLQMIRVMDKLWLKEGLDMKMITFGCVPTGDRQGLVEMVTEAKTLRDIEESGGRGVIGSFKETPVAEWLKKYNSSILEFEKATDNFSKSCAGYSIATYLLGICDRHNDNIMVKKSGHLFHIGRFDQFLAPLLHRRILIDNYSVRKPDYRILVDLSVN